MSINKQKINFPGIGLRIIKSAIGVFLCYVVNYLRGDTGIVFYSQLAVLWCMQDYISETKAKAVQRTIGTIIGALWGLIVILLYGVIPKNAVIDAKLCYSALVSAAIVLVLYTTVVLKKKQASYFSCVVFLSIVVNHIADANPYLFVFNRVMDTMIGIVIGVCVNCFRLPHKERPNVLYLSGVDDTLLAPDGEMSAYSRVELNRLIEEGVRFSISTIRTPASLMEPLRGIKLKLPVIVMDGAALYNINEKKYEYAYVISPSKSRGIREYLSQNEIPYFANVIIDDLLIIYYQKTNHAGYNDLIKRLRISPYRNYINRRIPDDESVVYFMITDVDERIEALYEKLKAEPLFDEFKLVMQPSTELSGYSMLKIYNHNATKENMIDYLKQKVKVEDIVTFGTIKGRYDYFINPGDFNRVVKLMKKNVVKKN